MQLTAGFGRTDITPEIGTLLMGYPSPGRTTEGIRDSLQANALALRQGDEAAIVVSLTVCIVDDAEVEAIRRGVADRTGIPPGHITICSTQTHSAPCTQSVWGWCDKDTDYIEQMMMGAIDAATDAAGQLQPVRVGIATTSSDVGVNRRAIAEDHSVSLGINPWGVYDPEMTVLRFEGESGPLATMIHYGAHPTVLGSESRLVSRDWPGVMVDRVEALTDAPVFFVNGTVGDVAPRTNVRAAVGDGETALMEVGCRGASDAMRAYRSVRETRQLDLDIHSGTFRLPYRPLATRREAEEQLKAGDSRKDEYGKGMCDHKHWQAVLWAHDEPPVSGKEYEQVIIRLGPMALVPFPGEPFAEIVMRLRELSPFQYTLCASTSCGNNGYFVTHESLHRGGYEVWVARAFGAYILVEDIDDVLVAENLALLRDLEGQQR